MFSDVVYHHCSEFQIFQSLNGFHFSVLSLYPNSVQNQACFFYSFLTTANQNKLTSFSHVLYSCHWLIKGGFSAKIDQSLVFPLCSSFLLARLPRLALNFFYLIFLFLLFFSVNFLPLPCSICKVLALLLADPATSICPS